jgi:hypothetical protein
MDNAMQICQPDDSYYRVQREVNKCVLLHDEQFGFQPRLSMMLQLACLVERVNRSFDEKRLTGAISLDVAKAFDTLWVKGVFQKLSLLNIPSHLVKTISTYLHSWTSEMSFQPASSTCNSMQSGVVQGGLVSSIFFSLYVNDMPTPYHYVKLAL